MTKKESFKGLYIFVSIVFIILVSLGTWQIQRLNWKNNLMAEIKAKMELEPINLSKYKHFPDFEEIKYRKVKVKGIFLNNKEIHLYSGARTESNKEGYLILTPFKISHNRYIIVERGWVPINEAKNSVKSWHNNKTVEVEGIILGPEHKTLFMPENDLKNNLWFYIDIRQMMEFTGLTLPHMFILEKKKDNTTLPIGKNFNLNIRNDHLQYAITWYGLALTLLVVFAFYIRSRKNNNE